MAENLIKMRSRGECGFRKIVIPFLSVEVSYSNYRVEQIDRNKVQGLGKSKWGDLR
jgi:hypothetical protein